METSVGNRAGTFERGTSIDHLWLLLAGGLNVFKSKEEIFSEILKHFTN
jgi:hypothetical protein